MKRDFGTKTIKIILLVVFVFVGCKAQQDNIVFKSNGKIDYHLSNDDVKLLDSIQYRSFHYFINESNPENGLVKDRSAVSYTHLRAHETVLDLVCRLLLEKKQKKTTQNKKNNTSIT